MARKFMKIAVLSVALFAVAWGIERLMSPQVPHGAGRSIIIR